MFEEKRMKLNLPERQMSWVFVSCVFFSQLPAAASGLMNHVCNTATVRKHAFISTLHEAFDD